MNQAEQNSSLDSEELFYVNVLIALDEYSTCEILSPGIIDGFPFENIIFVSVYFSSKFQKVRLTQEIQLAILYKQNYFV